MSFNETGSEKISPRARTILPLAHENRASDDADDDSFGDHHREIYKVCKRILVQSARFATKRHVNDFPL